MSIDPVGRTRLNIEFFQQEGKQILTYRIHYFAVENVGIDLVGTGYGVINKSTGGISLLFFFFFLSFFFFFHYLSLLLSFCAVFGLSALRDQSHVLYL